MSTAKEVMQKFQNIKAEKPGLPRHLSASLIANYWRHMCRFKYDDMRSAQPPFTQKKLGQFGLIKRRAGDSTKPVLIGVLDNWQGFLWAVQGRTGDVGPNRPDVGFLLMHLDVAISWVSQDKTELPKGIFEDTMPLVKKSEDKLPAESVKELTAQEIISLIKAGKLV